MNNIIINSCELWLNNLVPVIFPIYILTDLLINYGFINILTSALEKPFKKIFNLKGNSLIILLFSILSGFPSSARYINSFIEDKLISTETGNRLIKFCHFANPLFIINFIGLNILENTKLSFYILTSHYLSNFILAFIYKGKDNNEVILNYKQNSFGHTLNKSFKNTFNSLFIILGNLITFKLLIRIIFKYLNVSNLFKTLTALFLEITSGLYYLKALDISLILKAIIINFAINFGGLCIHSQVYSIMGTRLNYKSYLISRLYQALIATIILIIHIA